MKSSIFLAFSFIVSGLFAQVAPNQVLHFDFKKVDASIRIVPEENLVEGDVVYEFEVLQKKDSLFIDARNMEIRNVLLNNAEVSFAAEDNGVWIISNFTPGSDHLLSLTYTARPKQAMYFINWNVPDSLIVARQVWTQGQGKYTSHWLPSFDDQREKAVYSLKINFKQGYEVISNGVLKEKTNFEEGRMLWHYEMEQPMSSYLLAVAAGNYDSVPVETTAGVPHFVYFLPEDRELVEPTYRHSGEIFDFLVKEIGVAYPWQNYKQIPVQDFLYSGMENTGATIFSDALMVDEVAFNDQNYISVNAHELAHQWFGNFVTAATGEHHWLHEGFATYFALLAEREIFGEDHYYWKLFQSAEELKALSDGGKGESLLNPRASSLTFYQKGAWALHILRELIGTTAFKTAVKNYLDNNAYNAATTDDFLREAELASGKSLEAFKKNWLLQSAFQGTEALNSLKNSAFIRSYMEIAALREYSLKEKRELLERGLTFPVNEYIGQEVVYQLAEINTPEALQLYRTAFDTGNLHVRQAIAVSMETIPGELKNSFTSLLKDSSYLTMEYALLKLWMNYPGEAAKWLDATRDVQGFSNKNVRMLWLVINLVTPQVDPGMTREYFDELSGYTREYYPFEVRQNAFDYLFQINAFTNQNLIDLVKGAQHHNTRFRDFSRKLLDRLLQDPEYRQKFEVLKEEMTVQDREFLNARLIS